MTLPVWALLIYVVLWATLFRALMVRTNLAPPACRRCGQALERRHLGDPVCACRAR